MAPIDLNTTGYPARPGVETALWLQAHGQFQSRDALDLDSTVMTRYDAQEGAARGYDQRKSLWDNPAKRGRASHHPLIRGFPLARIERVAWREFSGQVE